MGLRRGATRSTRVYLHIDNLLVGGAWLLYLRAFLDDLEWCFPLRAEVAELADALGSGPSGH